MLMTDTALVRASDVLYVDISQIERQYIRVVARSHPETLEVTGFNAVELVYHLKPGALEGRRLKWVKRAWAFHNLVAHPVMQLLAYFGFYKQAMWVHDATVPRPRR